MGRSVVRTIEGYVSRHPAESQESGNLIYGVDFYAAEARVVHIPKSALEAAGMTFEDDVLRQPEGIVAAKIDILATRIGYPEDVEELTFKGWLPSLDEAYQG